MKDNNTAAALQALRDELGGVFDMVEVPLSVIVRPAPSLRLGSPLGNIRSDGVRTRLMACTNGDGARDEGSIRRVDAYAATA